MRRFFLASCAVLLTLGATIAAPTGAVAQTVTAQQQAQVAAILAQFPNGGTGLSDAIAAAVEADPSLAQAVVTAAANATPAQQQAIGFGLAAAAAFFAAQAGGTGPAADAARTAEQLIIAAMAAAPPLTQVAFGEGGGFQSLALGLGSGTTLTTNACVSPSNPGGRC